MRGQAGSGPPEQGIVRSEPYEAIAAGYDFVMRHVDYEAWAEYVVDLLYQHDADLSTCRVLELGCGTGSLALLLQRNRPAAYMASDRSRAMLAEAQRKAAASGMPIEFKEIDFGGFAPPGARFDLILLLYDGLNYLLEADRVRSFLRSSHDALRVGGLLVFDQSTPANSLKHESEFDDEGNSDRFRFIRRSSYDQVSRLHTTELVFAVDESWYSERHVQRAYEYEEIRTLVDESPFRLEAAYADFGDDPASSDSERIHWVLRRIQTNTI